MIFTCRFSCPVHSRQQPAWALRWVKDECFPKITLSSGVQMWWFQLMTSICLISVMPAFNLITPSWMKTKYLNSKHMVDLLMFTFRWNFGKIEEGCHMDVSTCESNKFVWVTVIRNAFLAELKNGKQVAEIWCKQNDFEVGSCRQLQALMPFVSYSLADFIADFSVKFFVSQRLFFLNVWKDENV